MTDFEIKLALDRYNRLRNNPKDIKCPGVTRKLARKLRKAGVL